MKKYYHFLITCFICLIPFRGMAEETIVFTVDQIKYIPVGDGTVKLYMIPSSAHHGAVTIPSHITHEGQSYQVTRVGRKVCRMSGSLQPDTTLRSISLPNTITFFEDSAFCNLSHLEHIDLPNDLQEMGMATFLNCVNLKTIRLPETLTKIAADALFNCGFEELYIPDSVWFIGARAFALNHNLKRIHLPDNLTTLSGENFVGCTALEALVIPPKVTHIGPRMFCFNLKYLKFEGDELPTFHPGYDWSIFEIEPDYARTDHSHTNRSPLGEKTICDYPLIYVQNESCLNMLGRKGYNMLPGRVWHDIAFEKDGLWYGVHDGDKAMVILPQFDFDSWTAPASPTYADVDTVIIPSEVVHEHVTYQVDSLDHGLFSLNRFGESSHVKHVTIQEGVRGIGPQAFKMCSDLKSVVFPQSMRNFGMEAFELCQWLVCELPDSVDVLDKNAFYDCKEIKKLPENLKKIKRGVFGFDEIPVDHLPECLEDIGPYAFWNSYLPNIKELPRSLKYIRDEAFSDATLYLHELPDSLKVIGNRAFSYCTGINTLETIPESVDSIGWSIFGKVSFNHPVYNSRFFIYFDYPKPNGNTSNYTIPEGITTICGFAFHYAHPRYLKVPKSVTVIDDPRFLPEGRYSPRNGVYEDYIIDMESVTPPRLTEQVLYSQFRGIIYVPAGCKGVYERAEEWGKYKIVEKEGDGNGIVLPHTKPAIDDDLFDLSGRRTNKPTRGLYIQGNRKVFIP